MVAAAETVAERTAATWTIAQWWYLANGGLPACLLDCLLARCLENGYVSLCSVTGLAAGRVIPTNQLE